jgi:uncharacterized damage-inducible protein DinB
MTSDIIDSIRAEFLRYKALAEGSIRQLADADLSAPGPNGGSSIATICWHISGNLQSRFTEFLTSDGEKPWRHREEEFEPRTVTRDELLAKWERGWSALMDALRELHDSQLGDAITIRQQPMAIREALHRAMAHIAYHVGQIVYVAKSIRGNEWQSLSIPPGQSDAYNKSATREKPAAHAAALAERFGDRT